MHQGLSWAQRAAVTHFQKAAICSSRRRFSAAQSTAWTLRTLIRCRRSSLYSDTTALRRSTSIGRGKVIDISGSYAVANGSDFVGWHAQNLLRLLIEDREPCLAGRVRCLSIHDIPVK
eukprot:SM000048S16565  [mRNA]  locus=s48:415261:415898:- [translate_table: standard]